MPPLPANPSEPFRASARGGPLARAASPTPWAVRVMQAADLPQVLAVQAEAYADAAFVPEQRGVYTNRMALAPGLCLVAQDEAGTLLGYLLSHPWHAGAPPALDTQLAALPPSATHWYLHDCAVAAAAHGRGVAAALYATACRQAVAQGLRRAALVAVGDAAGYWARLGYGVPDRPELSAKLAGYGPQARYMERQMPG